MTITTRELGDLEARVNGKYAKNGIAFALTIHFSFDRVNDPRNSPPIMIAELEDIFDRLIATHMQTLLVLGSGDSYNIRCTKTHINIPCAVEKRLSNRLRDYLHNAVTVMRNPTFCVKPGTIDLKV